LLVAPREVAHRGAEQRGLEPELVGHSAHPPPDVPTLEQPKAGVRLERAQGHVFSAAQLGEQALALAVLGQMGDARLPGVARGAQGEPLTPQVQASGSSAPDSARCTPESTFIKVDLPAPFSPTKASTSPGNSVR